MTAEPAVGTYQCELCQGVFDEGWSEEEALAEAERNGVPADDRAIVCDDCYQLVMAWWRQQN